MKAVAQPERPYGRHVVRRIVLRLVTSVFVAILLVACLVWIALGSYVPGF